MSLRDDLANALYDAYCDGPRLRSEHPDKPEVFRWKIDQIQGDANGSAEMHQEPWLRAADECLRQMEWARSMALSSCCGESECMEMDDGLVTALAPPEWKP